MPSTQLATAVGAAVAASSDCGGNGWFISLDSGRLAMTGNIIGLLFYMYVALLFTAENNALSHKWKACCLSVVMKHPARGDPESPLEQDSNTTSRRLRSA